jgi:hypothetical protein
MARIERVRSPAEQLGIEGACTREIAGVKFEVNHRIGVGPRHLLLV